MQIYNPILQPDYGNGLVSSGFYELSGYRPTHVQSMTIHDCASVLYYDDAQ